MSPVLTLLLLCALFAALGSAEELFFSLRRQQASSPGSSDPGGSESPPIYASARWNASKTAFVVCDMWDKHWCIGASRRVDALAPAMNTTLRAGRDRGVLIVHAPSDTMPFYERTPQRARAEAAPAVASAPKDIALWRPLDPAQEPPLPIDDSDGGCDDLPACSTYCAWTCQHPALQIDPEDAISDSGTEIHRLLEQRGIENIVVMGVHTNLCVLGRSFGIRRLVALGKNVALLRDMTDSLYNPRKRPFVSHFHGTELVVKHIETYWCPSITSDQIVGGAPFVFPEQDV